MAEPTETLPDESELPYVLRLLVAAGDITLDRAWQTVRLATMAERHTPLTEVTQEGRG